jgi:alpha-L-rhamnosidase
MNRKWTAKWIWSDAQGHESNVYYYFRKTFDLDGDTEGHRIFITADTRYQLFINGSFVGRGSPQSQPYFQYYDEYDLSDCLLSGRNCIAVIVNHVGNMDDTRGGLLLEVTDSQAASIVVTDDTWPVVRAEAWEQNTYAYFGNRATPYQEFFDARKEPEGWRDLGFDDSDWPLGTVIGERSDRPPAAGPWSKLLARDIPFMTSDPVLPKRVEGLEESLDLDNRSRRNDLAPGLSMVGTPIRYTRFDQVENLCTAKGTTKVQCSLNHLDLDFDGIYAPAVILDFGHVITARSRICLKGTAGGMVDIGYAERLIDGHFNIAMECEFADRYTMKDGEQVFESFTWKSFRYLKLRFRSCFEALDLHSVHAVVSTYPYQELGEFSSDDATLNAVFDISRATIRLCSNEFLMDTPWREQAQWLGDAALVTVPAIHSCFGETALTRKFIMQAGQNQHPTGMISNISNTVNKNWLDSIPDFSLWWIKGLLSQFLYTGEEELLNRLYPQALRILDAHLDYLNKDTLIEDMPFWVFIDWADVERRGICSAYNAIFYDALQSLFKLAIYRGDTYTSKLTRELRNGMKASFHKTLFDKKRGCYTDACIDGEISESISEHGNMTPVWAGLCDADITRQVISKVFESDGSLKFTEAQPFYMAVILSALDGAERFDLALDLIRQRWGKRMLDQGATSAFEEWYQNGSWRDGTFRGFLRTHSHAWSACPADFLIRHFLGLKILEPGCQKLRLAPRKTTFDYNIAFPTPQGPVTATCTNGELKVTSPDSIEIQQ